MALPTSVDYTDKDFDSIRLRLQALIRSVFPTWTDFEVTNFGNILTDMFAFTGDILTFYQDSSAAESRIVTATQRRSLLALCKLINYVPALAQAASATETFTAVGLANNATIPAGLVIETPDGIAFQLLSSLLLTPGTPTATGVVEHSTTNTQFYTGTGQKNQTVLLSEPPFLSVVSVSLGGSWSKVDNFLFSTPTDKVYTLTVDNNDRATISFGDGVNGLMPTGAMTILYKTGGGAIGNVAAGSITQISVPVLDTLSNVVNLSATNVAASGGADRETNASIKLRAPLSITNPNSSIARVDFEVHAIEVPSVARALMQTTNEDPTIPDNSGSLYIVPTGNPPVAPSATLIDKVRRQFEGDTQERPPFPKPLTFNLSVLPTNFVEFTLNISVFIKRGFSPVTVGIAIRDALLEFFNPIVTDETRADFLGVEVGALNPLIDFGYYLRQQSSAAFPPGGFVELSDLMDVVHDVAGVRGIGPLTSDFTVYAERMTGPFAGIVANYEHVDVQLLDSDFPKWRINTIVITDIDTGNSI